MKKIFFVLVIQMISFIIFSGCNKESNGANDSNEQVYTANLAGSYGAASDNKSAMVIKIQKNGKILVLGYQWFIRLEQDGVTIDKSFNPVSEIAASPKVKSFEIQDDGKIIVYGHFSLSSGHRAIVRLNIDGSIDNSFNIPEINFDYFTQNVKGPGIESIKILGNGKMIVAGKFEYGTLPITYGTDIARLNADQSIDFSFSSPISGDVYGITNMLALKNGSFLLAGYGAIRLKDRNSYNVVRISADGVYDNSFVYDVGGAGSRSVIVGDMHELSNGKILLGGNLGSGYANSVLRFNVNGSVDNIFKEYATNETISSLLVLADDNILIGFNPNRNLPTERKYLSYINASGVEHTTFKLDFTNASVNTLSSIDKNTILMGGNFTLNNTDYSVIRLKKN